MKSRHETSRRRGVAGLTMRAALAIAALLADTATALGDEAKPDAGTVERKEPRPTSKYGVRPPEKKEREKRPPSPEPEVHPMYMVDPP